MLGKRTRKFFAQRQQAEKYATDLNRRYLDGRWGRVRESLVAPQTAQARSITLAAAIGQWLDFQKLRVQTNKKRQVSLDTDRMRLKGALSFFGDVALSSITEEKLTRFQAHRLNVERRKPATINSDLVALGKVLRWAHKLELLKRLPEVERIQDEACTLHVPTEAEVTRIIAALPERLQTLVWFLAETGCRTGEVFNLRWDCVDELTGIIQIKPQNGWTPKTRSSQRKVFVQGQLLESVQRLPKLGPYVFAGQDPNRPINNIKRAFASAVKAALIEREGKPLRVTPHTLRKAYATWLAIDRGVPQGVLQSLLGHTRGSRVTDQYYVIAQDEAKRLVAIGLPVAEQIAKNSRAPRGNTVATGVPSAV